MKTAVATLLCFLILQYARAQEQKPESWSGNCESHKGDRKQLVARNEYTKVCRDGCRHMYWTNRRGKN